MAAANDERRQAAGRRVRGERRRGGDRRVAQDRAALERDGERRGGGDRRRGIERRTGFDRRLGPPTVEAQLRAAGELLMGMNLGALSDVDRRRLDSALVRLRFVLDRLTGQA